MLTIIALMAAAQAAPATAPENDPVICKGRSESVVGTRIKPKKTCMKKSDWAYIEKRTQEELNQINQRGNNPGLALGRNGGPE
jgi:hypothetical protein